MKKAKRTGLAANPATASGLVKASKIADRIQAFLEKLAAKGIDLLEDAVEDQQQLVSYLADILEEHSARHVSIINKLSKAQGFGPTSAAKIQKALAKAQAGRAKGNTITESAKKKSGLGKGNGTGKKGKSVFGLKTTIARGKVQATAKESPRTQGRDAPTTPATLTAEVRPVLKTGPSQPHHQEDAPAAVDAHAGAFLLWIKRRPKCGRLRISQPRTALASTRGGSGSFSASY